MTGRKQGTGNGGGSGTPPPEPDKPKTQPRDYIVYREFTVRELIARLFASDPSDVDAMIDEARKVPSDERPMPSGFTLDADVLVALGEAQGATPKAARVYAAKAFDLSREELDADKGGVPLNAIPARAATGGRAPVKLRIREDFE